MNNLEATQPDDYFHFYNGLYVVCISDRHWAGLSTDLVIEQCLMQNLKSIGSLTHGSSMTESQRSQWVLLTTVCAEVHNSMQEVSCAKTETGHQNRLWSFLCHSRLERQILSKNTLKREIPLNMGKNWVILQIKMLVWVYTYENHIF